MPGNLGSTRGAARRRWHRSDPTAVGVATGILPLVDVLLVLMVLLMLIVANAGQGAFQMIPLSVPQAYAKAAEGPPAPLPLISVTAEAIEAQLPGETGLRPLVLPEASLAPGDPTLVVFCQQAGLLGASAIRVAAAPDSVHQQLSAVFGFAQQCGVFEIQLVVKPPRRV